MSDRLKTPADLAEVLGSDVRQVLEWRRLHNWPSFKVGKTIRFTDEQVAEIVHLHSQQLSDAKPSGQTARSSRRRSA